MTYSVEVIKSAIERFLNEETAEEISRDIGVSKAILFSWLTPENGINDEETLKKLSKRVRELTKQRSYLDAMPICKNFGDNEIFQSQLVTILTQMYRLDEAKAICSRFKDHVPMQSQLVTILIRQNRLEDAKKICEKFKEAPSIQSQLITILKKQGKTREAKEICKNFPDAERIQSQLLTILIEEGELEKAKEICDKFPHWDSIQHQLPTLQMKASKSKSIGEFFKTEVSEIKTKARKTQEAQDISYLEDIEQLDIISGKKVGDLRAKMQLLVLLKKYNMNDVAERQLKDENEIYQEILRLVLFARDNPDFNRSTLVGSRLVQGIKGKIIKIGGNEKYANELVNKAIEEPSL